MCVFVHLLFFWFFFNRLNGELDEKQERWFSCQQRCDTLQKQMSSWRRKEEEINRKCCSAEEEVTQLREAFEKVQQETRQLRRERSWLWYLLTFTSIHKYLIHFVSLERFLGFFSVLYSLVIYILENTNRFCQNLLLLFKGSVLMKKIILNF